MAEKKNQHFVPRCHLKPFTLDGEGRAINVFNAERDRAFERAPVKGQCARHYFYGRDLVLENFLQSLEAEYGGVVGAIIGGRTEVTDKELRFLCMFAYLQMTRTEFALKRRRQAIRQWDDISYRGFGKNPPEQPYVSDEMLVRMGFKMFFNAKDMLNDLDVVLLANETSRDFVTSDDPAVLVNKLFVQRMGSRTTGLISTGAQLLLPIAPKLALICFDPAAYHFENRRGCWVDLTDSRDVDALNELQFISCNENIYFCDWSELSSVRSGYTGARHLRPSEWFRNWVGVLEEETETIEFYRRVAPDELPDMRPRIVSGSPIYPAPSKWLSSLGYRLKVYGYTNGSAVGYIRKARVPKLVDGPPFRRELVKPRKEDPLGPKTALLRKSDIEA